MAVSSCKGKKAKWAYLILNSKSDAHLLQAFFAFLHSWRVLNFADDIQRKKVRTLQYVFDFFTCQQ